MRYLWISMALVGVIGLDPGVALAGCQTWTIMDQGQVKVCTQCCYLGGNCTITCM